MVIVSSSKGILCNSISIIDNSYNHFRVTENSCNSISLATLTPIGH